MKSLLVFTLIIFTLTSCDNLERILEVDISEEKVELLAPANQTEFSGEQEITLYWERLEDAEKYQLQIARPNFSQAIEIVTDTTISDYEYTQYFETGDYQWRVKTENKEYETGYTSARFRVTE